MPTGEEVAFDVSLVRKPHWDWIIQVNVDLERRGYTLSGTDADAPRVEGDLAEAWT